MAGDGAFACVWRRRDVPTLFVAAGVAAAGVALSSAFSNGSGSALPRVSRAGGVLELRTTFRGKYASYFGSAREWYSPRSGLFRVQASIQGKTKVQVFDGRVWSSSYDGDVERQSGRPAMFRWLFVRSSPLAKPGFGLNAVDSFLGLNRSKQLHVVSPDGGHTLDAVASLGAAFGGSVRFRVVAVRRLTPAQARRTGLFKPPIGRLAKDLRESRAGTRPQFGEPGYWFGSRLGRARAVATLDSWRLEHAPGTSSADYMTVYRLPVSVASAVPSSSRVPAYPGLGDQPPSDVWVECHARTRGVTVPTGVGKRVSAVIKTGERAKVTTAVYTQGGRAGTQAVIVLRDAFCDVRGLVAPAAFRRALAAFGPVR
jgi:hypothetical protein